MSNFIKNPSSGGGVFPCGRTDRHDEVNSRISQFWERAYNGYQSVATEVKICSVIAFRQIVTYWLTLRNRVLLEKLTGFQLVNKFPAFMEPAGSLPHSQAPATRPHPVLGQTVTESIQNQNAYYMSNNFSFSKKCRVWDNVKKYGTSRQATDDKIIRRMRTVCWIPDYRHIHNI